MRFVRYFFRYVCARLIFDAVRAVVRRRRNPAPHCHGVVCFLFGAALWFVIAGVALTYAGTLALIVLGALQR